MTSQSSSFEYEKILHDILEFAKLKHLKSDHPLVKEEISKVFDVQNAQDISMAIVELSKHEYLSSLSEDFLVDYLKVFPCWCYNVYYSFLNELEKREDITSSLQNISTCLVSFTNFVNFACNYKQGSKIILTEKSLKVLFDCYFQCICSDSFSEVVNDRPFLKDQFENLIKECKLLKKSLINLLGESDFNYIAQEELPNFVSCCDVLLQLIISFNGIDPKQNVPFLKIFAILFKSNNGLFIKDQLNTNIIALIVYLCRVLIKQLAPFSIESSKNENALNLNASEKKGLLKLCNFELKILILLTDTMQRDLSGSLDDLVEFLLFLFELKKSKKIQSGQNQHQKYIACNNEEENELETLILVGIEPLIISLISVTEFLHCVYLPRKNIMPLSYCLFQIFMLDKIIEMENEVLEMWLNYCRDTDDKNLLLILLDTVELLCLENLSPTYVPSMMLNGQAQLFNSVYQHVCTHICIFVASLPSCYFHIAEDALLRALLSPCIWLSIMASDIWCFISRYCTSHLCLQHCQLLGKLYIELPEETRLISLLTKLHSFLSPAHKTQFAKDFPLRDHLSLWTYLSVEDENVAIHSLYQSHSKLFCENSETNVQTFDLSFKISLTFLFLRHLPSLFAVDAFNFLNFILNRIYVCDAPFQKWFFSKLISCVYIFSKSANNDNVKSMESMLGHLVNSNTHTPNKFVENCKILLVFTSLKGLSIKILRNNVPKEIPQLFRCVLNHENYFLQCLGFELLSMFAHLNTEEWMLKSILKTDVQQRFSNFLKKMPCFKSLTSDEIKYIANFLSKIKDQPSKPYAQALPHKNIFVRELVDNTLQTDSPNKRIKTDKINASTNEHALVESIEKLEDVLLNIEQASLIYEIQNNDAARIVAIAKRLLDLGRCK